MELEKEKTPKRPIAGSEDSLVWLWGYWSAMQGKKLESAPFNRIRGTNKVWIDGYEEGRIDFLKRKIS